MNEQLRNYVDDYGGKHGPLLYIREHITGGADLVPPMEVTNLLELSQRMSAPEIARGIISACRELGVEEFIARTSLKGFGDFDGLVDMMPTIQHIPLRVLDESYPPCVARTLLDSCQDPGLKRFAAGEGVVFDESDVIVSFSPQIGFPHSTITEHPNQSERTMVDIYRPFPPYTTYEASKNMSLNDTVNFDGDEIQNRHEFDEELFLGGLQVRRLMREADILDHDLSAYQYEGACRGPAPHWLVQIRLFAPKRQADFVLGEGGVYGRTKVMGITTEEGVPLVFVQGDKRKSATQFENDNPDVQYLFNLATDGSTKKLQLDDQTVNMRGYSVALKPFLSHQNTRFAQSCLRHQNGFVELNTSLLPYRNIENGTVIRVICDGVRRVVKKV